MRRRFAFSSGNRSRCGLTLVEFLVSLFVIVVIFAIALPYIRAAREAARETRCRNQLREIGIAIYTWSDSDPQKRFCTGDYNFMTDGDPSKYSWVGNFLAVNGDARVLNCPSSSVIASDTINELLGRANQPFSSFPPPSQRDGALFTALFDPLTGKERLVASAERDSIVRNALENGLYSNYQASWFFVRGELLIDYKDEMRSLTQRHGDVHPIGCNRMWSGSGADPDSGKATCTGPMTHRLGARSGVPMSAIPWLSEAGISRGNSTLLRLDPQTVSLDSAGYLTDGAALYSNADWGPAYFSDGKLCHLNEGFLGKELFGVENLEVAKYPTINQVPGRDVGNLNSGGGPMILQDTRSWRPAHGPRSSVLMGDGSVKTLTDLNGDGYFNPGFAISKDQTGLGYQHGPCELDVLECYSGVLLWEPRIRTHFDDDY